MFYVSNAIAYVGQMVHAVAPARPGPIGAVLGKSRWLNVLGAAETKWCPAEGDAVIEMLAQLSSAGIEDPELPPISTGQSA
uniref:hypothetical protein n=2 Tax=unclassified Rhizobium TaxID=2613769 RepID=UPI00403F122A